jgi:chromosomal replication initiator protein
VSIDLCPCCGQPRPESPTARRRLMITEIQAQVATYYGIPIGEMTSDRRARAIARPRQVAMYLSKQFTPMSLPSIGQRFGHRDHSTVIHACWQIERLCQIDEDLSKDVGVLTRELEALEGAAPQ